jgi:hypothetical protein
MYFGITRRHLMEASIAGAVLGGLLLLLFLCVGIAEGTVQGPLDGLKFAALSLMVGAGLPFFVGIGAILGIRVVGGQVEQVIFGRWVLRRRAVAELAGAAYGGSLFPVVLSFRDGAHIRLLGVPRHGPDLSAHLPYSSPAARCALRPASNPREEKKTVCDLPFRSVALAPEWRTPPVVNLAQVIDDEGSFEDLPILGDALEEAGCTDAGALSHCRAPGPHARGCWVVDLILGKESEAVGRPRME